MRRDAKERFAARLAGLPLNGCWNWPGVKGSDGYGQIRVDGKMVYTHRFAYELFVGPIPKGYVVMHTCDNPSCCNPQHLRSGTHQENMRDMIRKGRASWQKKTKKTAAAKQVPAIA